MNHGTPDEDEVRYAALDACKARGIDCLGFNGTLSSVWNDTVCVHILHWRSPVDGQFKLGSQNFYEQGKARGVTRYQVLVNPGFAERWKDLVKDYPADTVQFLADDVDGVRKIITTRPVVKRAE